MSHAPKLIGATVDLAQFRVEHIDDAYIDWLNDPLVTRFLEFRYTRQTRETASAYVNAFYGDAEKYAWRILMADSAQWIGTATMYDVDRQHLIADIGMLIGDRRFWGRGIACETIGLMMDFAFGALGLRKISAGTYAENAAMNRCCERLGFTREGILRQQCQVRPGEFVDVYRWGMLAEEWRNERE